MTIDELSRLAATEQVPPEGTEVDERCLWYGLRDIYRQFRQGSISTEQGDQLKRQAIRQYNTDHGRLEQADRILAQHGQMFRSLEDAADQCRKELSRTGRQNTEEALHNITECTVKLLDALYGKETTKGALGIGNEKTG